MLQKVNLLTRPTPRKKEPKHFKSEGFDETVELMLAPLTDFEEIEASEMADDLFKEHKAGYPIGGDIVNVPAGAWRLACRFNMMQPDEYKLYAPEEFILMFAKFQGIASQILDFTKSDGKADKKKGSHSGSGSSESASTEGFTPTS